ncbi:hypothetical protein [Aquimarina latercula]|uniref:hypothetical protein n=1 Tax=Aquimarina latercula TaxID=987 RepID=UPI000413BD0A|nr:hypothetical protein [Aquimarina latercula]
MMDHFIISKSKDKLPKEHQLKLTDAWYLNIDGEKYEEYLEGDVRILVFGDYIGTKEQLFTIDVDQIPKLKGNFYAIVIEENHLKIYSSFLNVLPLYHTSDFEYISSSIEYIRKKSDKKFEMDRKFILESLLFNYGFFNRTLYKGIELAPCHYFLELTKEKSTIKKHFDTVSLFTQEPSKGSKTADKISALFIETTKEYFPKDTFDIAFTSGFDGRTLVSCATHFDKKFNTFSFGKLENEDVAIPKENAKAIDIPYQYFDLGSNEYIEEHYIKNANEYNSLYPSGNGLIYSHFLYSTKEITKKSKYLISGVVGSELFRALHLTGAVTSQALVDIFTSTTADEIKDRILNAKPLLVINKEDFAGELEELIEELIDYKESIPKDLTQNQQFYTFVFEEIFRKFFGQWIYIQMIYIKVRTPFLDYTFIKELLKTQYAGANNDFFTENPLKRMKGQYIYADIIKKTNTQIYHQKTGKGYRPKDIREPFGLFNILFPFIKKRLKRKVKQTNLDNLGIISGTLAQQSNFKNLIEETDWIDQKYVLNILDKLSPYTNEKERDTLLMSISLISALKQNPNQSNKYLLNE